MAEATSKSQLPSIERLLRDLALSPHVAGLIGAAVLVGAFLASELLLGRHKLVALQTDPILATRDARIAIVHCLLSVYLPLATVLLRIRTRENLRALARTPGADGPALQRMAAQVGSGGTVAVWSARAFGILLLFGAAYLSTPSEYWDLLWDFPAMAPEVRWHRILGLWVGWWVGDYTRTGLVEAARLSRSASLLAPLDLIDPATLAPYTRQALTILLAAVGLGSLVALFAFERGYVPLVASIWAITFGFGGTMMWMALRGIHARIRDAKAEELSRCRVRLSQARAALDAGRNAEPRLSELVAWESRIESVREWPFDTSALTRIALYGLIPLLSWSGGALVERVIDTLLD